MKILNLKNLFYLTIFCVPLYLIRFSFFGLPTNVLEILIGISVFFWALRRDKAQYLNIFYLKYKPYFFFVGLIFVGLFISTFKNDGWLTGMGVIKGWFLVPVSLAIIMDSTFQDKKKDKIYLAFYLSAFFVALISLGYFFLGKVTFDGRLTGFYNSPNYLAMYIAPSLFIGYEFFWAALKSRAALRDRKKMLIPKEIFYLASFIIILISLYLTYSYASWLAVFLAFCGVIFIKKKLITKKIFFLLLFLVVFFLLQINQEKLSAIVSFNPRSSLASRAMIWESSWKILSHNWAWGIGPGNFQNEYLNHQKYFPPYLEWAVPHPHNLYLAFWLYGGAIGFLGFLGLLFFWARTFFQKFKTIFNVSEENKKLFLVSLGIMFYFLIHGLVDTTYFKNDLSVIFWINFFMIF